jgi:hypothetical protein
VKRIEFGIKGYQEYSAECKLEEAGPVTGAVFRLLNGGRSRKERALILIILMGLMIKPYPVAGASNKHGFFVPGIPAPGFTISLGPEFYGTERRPLENSHIFNFIDGGGVVYINHGFRAVVHIVFTDQSRNTITVDAFDMGNEGNARKAYADESICPAGFKMVSIGVEAKAYHFEPDYFIYFVKGRYLVYCHANNDALSGLLTKYAKTLVREVQ